MSDLLAELSKKYNIPKDELIKVLDMSKANPANEIEQSVLSDKEKSVIKKICNFRKFKTFSYSVSVETPKNDRINFNFPCKILLFNYGNLFDELSEIDYIDSIVGIFQDDKVNDFLQKLSDALKCIEKGLDIIIRYRTVQAYSFKNDYFDLVDETEYKVRVSHHHNKDVFGYRYYDDVINIDLKYNDTFMKTTHTRMTSAEKKQQKITNKQIKEIKLVIDDVKFHESFNIAYIIKNELFGYLKY